MAKVLRTSNTLQVRASFLKDGQLTIAMELRIAPSYDEEQWLETIQAPENLQALGRDSTEDSRHSHISGDVVNLVRRGYIVL